MTLRNWPDPTGELGPRPTIIDYLFDDASHVATLLDEIQQHIDAGFFESARATSTTLSRRLERHLRLEESSVLPQLPAGGAGVVAEHAELRRQLAAVALHLDEGRATPSRRALARLRRTMQRHEQHERRLFTRYRERI
jgi:hypothetical protein